MVYRETANLYKGCVPSAGTGMEWSLPLGSRIGQVAPDMNANRSFLEWAEGIRATNLAAADGVCGPSVVAAIAFSQAARHKIGACGNDHSLACSGPGSDCVPEDCELVNRSNSRAPRCDDRSALWRALHLMRCDDAIRFSGSVGGH